MTKKTKAGVEVTINLYRPNPNAKPIKTILHPTIPAGGKDDLGNPISAWNGFKQKIKQLR